MFLAHLPAGYLVATRLRQKLLRNDLAPKSHAARRALIATGLAASVLPDVDLFWFYLVDNRQTAHHAYFTHWPLFWVGLALAAWIIARIANKPQAIPFIWMALAGTLLHMALDSVAAEIRWLKPFAPLEIQLVHVPALYDWWVWNFVLHWTFWIELLIIAIAAIVFWRDRGERTQDSND